MLSSSERSKKALNTNFYDELVMQNQLYEMLIKEDEITWQTIIYDLIRSEQMDPWDIDLSLLTNKYLEAVKTMQEMNLFISGKVVLAAALLLRIKSTKLVAEDIAMFDEFLFHSDSEELMDDLLLNEKPQRVKDIPRLAIKTPQARKRKVTVQDLLTALQKALEVNQRKVMRKINDRTINVQLPKIKFDVTLLIKNIYEKLLELFKKEDEITFLRLVSSEKKEDKIFTFIPLLHLDNQGKINLSQETPFGEIKIRK